MTENTQEKAANKIIENTKKIGQIGSIKVGNFTIKVILMAFKQSFGRDRWYVRPVEGSGMTWVENVEFDVVEESEVEKVEKAEEVEVL